MSLLFLYVTKPFISGSVLVQVKFQVIFLQSYIFSSRFNPKQKCAHTALTLTLCKHRKHDSKHGGIEKCNRIPGMVSCEEIQHLRPGNLKICITSIESL